MRRFSADTSGAASIYAIGSRFISGGLFRQQNSSPPSGPYREPTLSGLEARGQAQGQTERFLILFEKTRFVHNERRFSESGETSRLSPVSLSPVSRFLNR